jgi:O-antigen ligase
MNFFNNLNPIFVIIGAIVAAIILYRPFLGLMAMVFMIPIETVVTFSAGFTAIKVLGIVTFISFLLSLVRRREKIEINRKIYVPLILLMLWVALTMEGNFFRLLTLIQLIVFLMMTIALCYNNDRRLILLSWIFIIGCSIATCWASLGYLDSAAIGARASVPGQNVNKFGNISGMGIIISLFLKERWKGYKQILLYGAVIFFLYGMIISASRGVVVALCLVLPIYLVGNKRRLKSVGNLLLIALLASSLFFVGLRKGLITEYTVNRILSIENYEDTTMPLRFTIWRVGWKIAQDNFITGVGLGNFPLEYSKYRGIYSGRVATLGWAADPHNTYLSIFAETGVIGFLLFLWFHGNLFFLILKKINANAVFALCILVFIGLISLKGTLHFSKFYWFGISLSYLIFAFSSQNFHSEDNKKPERDKKQF